MINLLLQRTQQPIEPPGEMLVHTWVFVAIIIGLIVAAIYISYQESTIKQLKKENKKLKKETQ
jgi:uncharacterized membrane-anchored protein YhcB (DUF1043 family)